MKLAIYHTTDMHGHVLPTNYVEYQELGMLKILSFIDEDRKNYDHSLVLDGGDLIQGTVLTSFLAKNPDENNPILKLLDNFSYDAYVMGNHEFNYGLDYLLNSYHRVSDKILNSNIENLDFKSDPYKIFDFEGFKIAVFGATTSYIPNWEQEKNIKDLVFHNPIEMYKKYEAEMKENSDMIIVLYHGGFEKSLDEHFIPTEILRKENQGSEFLETFDSIDIMLTGHQHRGFITKIKDVICSQPINNARNFTKIVYDTESNEWSYELIDITSMDIEIKDKYEKIFDETNKDLDEYLNQVIGHFDESIRLGDKFDVRLNGHPYINFLHEVQLDALEADFSSLSLFDQAIGFDKEVTIKDVLVNYPYPNTLKVMEITGEDLKEAIEISTNYFKLDENDNIILNPRFQVPKVRNYIYDFFYGLDYVVDLGNDRGKRVVSMKKDGQDIDMDKTYRIIMNNYRASNTAEYPCYQDKKIIDETSLDMSELMIAYISKKKNLKVNKTKNFIISN